MLVCCFIRWRHLVAATASNHNNYCDDTFANIPGNRLLYLFKRFFNVDTIYTI